MDEDDIQAEHIYQKERANKEDYSFFEFVKIWSDSFFDDSIDNYVVAFELCLFTVAF